MIGSNKTRNTPMIQVAGFLSVIWIGVALTCAPTSGSWKEAKEERQRRVQEENESWLSTAEYRLPADYLEPELIHSDVLEYRAVAMEADWFGDIEFVVYISSFGSVKSVQRCSSSGHLAADSAAEQMVASLDFASAVVDSVAVESSYRCRLSFLKSGQSENGSALDNSNYGHHKVNVVKISDEVDVPPELIRMAPPIYTPFLKKSGMEGTVWVQVLVDMHGIVRRANVVKEYLTCLA